MKLGNIIDKIRHLSGSPIGSALKAFIPGVAGVDAVLGALSGATGKKLVKDSPVQDVVAALDELPPEHAAAVMEKEIDLEIVESNNYAQLAIAQEQNNSATRPQIAKDQSDFVIAIGKASFVFLAMTMIIDMIIVLNGEEQFAFDIAMKGLPWFVGVFVVKAFGVIQQYFARRSDDKRTAMSGHGVEPPAASGLVMQFGSLFRKGAK